MRVLIPAMGDGVRFGDEEKLLTEFNFQGHKRSMIEHVLNSILEQGHQPVIAVPPRLADAAMRGTFFGSAINYVYDKTSGQGETVALMLLSSMPNDDVVVVNADMVLDFPIDAFVKMAMGYDVAALVQPIHDPSWSYVDGFPEFRSAVEKQVVDPFMGLCGMYYLSASAIEQFGRVFWELGRTTNEKYTGPEYLSQMFTKIAGKKLAIHTGSRGVHDFGTPDRIRRYDSLYSV